MVAGWIYSIIMAALPLFGISNYSSTRFVLVTNFLLRKQSYELDFRFPYHFIGGMSLEILLTLPLRTTFALFSQQKSNKKVGFEVKLDQLLNS